jgi:glycosyltransferase involved in cell wall biosynthesis
VPYQVPFYRALQEEPRIRPRVLYLSRIGIDEVVVPEFNHAIRFESSLLDGYEHEFVRNWSWNEMKPLVGRINPGLAPALVRGGYDAVLVTGYTMLSAHLAMAASKLSGIKLLLRAEADLTNPSSGLRRRLKERLLGPLLSMADAVMYSCEANKDYFRHYGVPERKLFPLLSSVDNDHYQRLGRELAPRRPELRAALGAQQDQVVFLGVGRFSARKRFADILDAAARLAPHQDRFLLVLAGDGPLRGELEAQARALGLTNVRFAGYKAATEMPELYAAADAFVLASSYDPTPKTVNEAMVFGLPPVVSTGAGTSRDLVRHQETGLVYDTGDTAGLAASMERLLLDSGLRRTLGELARETVRQWSPQANARGVLEALDHCFADQAREVANG